MVKRSKLFAISIIVVVLLVGISLINALPFNTQYEESTTQHNNTLEVFFFDVGQGDCILLKTGNHNMLIDAGDGSQSKNILNYLAKYNVTNLDYLVATHPHADHIGSMSSVIKEMDNVNKVIMPDKTHTTKTFEDLIDVIEEHDIPLTIPNSGDIFTLGDASIHVLAPNSATYNDINDYSIVLRVEFGDTSFLFTGDAEAKSEGEQLLNRLHLNADVLKVGHHGSKSSSTQKYLDAVSPNYAVISIGANNPYKHPHNEVITRLSTMGVAIYRTDTNGTIIFTSDGKQIVVSSENESKSIPTILTELLIIKT